MWDWKAKGMLREGNKNSHRQWFRLKHHFTLNNISRAFQVSSGPQNLKKILSICISCKFPNTFEKWKKPLDSHTLIFFQKNQCPGCNQTWPRIKLCEEQRSHQNVHIISFICCFITNHPETKWPERTISYFSWLCKQAGLSWVVFIHSGWYWLRSLIRLSY